MNTLTFPVKLIVANALVYGVGFLVPPFSPFAGTWVWLAVVLWYLGLTSLLNRWIQAATKRSSIQFITAVNGATAIKMFSSLGLVTAYLVAVGGQFRVHFVLGLFAVFAINTILLVLESQNLAAQEQN
jgi:hypothetical protein